MNTFIQLIKYWLSIEAYRPFYPKGDRFVKTGGYKEMRSITWGADRRFRSYNVYLGKLNTQSLIADMLVALGENPQENDISDDKCCLLSFQLDEEGSYARGSFCFSPFIYAVSKITKNKDLFTGLSQSETDEINAEFDEYMSSFAEPLSADEMLKIYTMAAIRIGMKKHKRAFFSYVAFRTEEASELFRNSSKNDMFSSSYKDDLVLARDLDLNGGIVQKFVEARSTYYNDRLEIDTDAAKMQKFFEPDKMPYGKWPSDAKINMMQQLAINAYLSEANQENPVFSISAPQDSGHIAIVQELIADTVVKKAMAMSSYESPDDAFEKSSFEISGQKRDYFLLDLSIAEHSMLIAGEPSTVVNISGAQNVKPEFASATINEDTYFASLAQSSIASGSFDPWSLICIPIENKKGIEAVKDMLWFGKSDSLKKQYGYSKPSFEDAKANFLSKLKQVENYRLNIWEAIGKSNWYNKTLSEYEASRSTLDSLSKQHDAGLKGLKELRSQRERLESELGEMKAEAESLSQIVPSVKKALKFAYQKDENLQKLIKLEEGISELSSIITKSQDLFAAADKEFNAVDNEKKKAEALERQTEKALRVSEEEIHRYKVIFGDNFADRQFWSDIVKKKKSQLSCPWTTREYDTLREELFYSALLLCKAFILNSDCMKINIIGILEFFNGSNDKPSHVYDLMLRSLCLIVPAPICSLPSIGSVFSGAGPQSFGMAVILNADKYSPYAAIGALRRARKALIIGDPMQAEPYLPIPKEFARRFSLQYEISEPNKALDLSIVDYADTMSVFGTYDFATKSQAKKWCGLPLLIQSRSSEPMFSVSSAIAYNNRLFSSASFNSVFEYSEWIDIAGQEAGENNHFVESQASIVFDIAKGFFEEGKSHNILVISPFESVISGIKQKLFQELGGQESTRWIHQNCGVISKMRGRTAGTVVLVLGCDFINGEKAVRWASKSANLLNSAVCMALSRLIVIGDRDLWSRAAHFSSLSESLIEQHFVRTTAQVKYAAQGFTNILDK